MSYAKLFSHIITSSIWTEDDRTRILWITMLAIADRNGEVMASIPGLARVAGIPIAATERGIAKFLSPDKHSRTKDDEGRRLEEIDGGWHIINYAKHRRMASFEEAKEKNAERQQRFRDKQRRNGRVTGVNGPVTQSIDKAEAEADSEAKAKVGSAEPTTATFGQNQSEWLANLSHHYPDRDVAGELESFSKFCSGKGTAANRRGFEGWLKKASPAVRSNGERHVRVKV